MMRYYYTHATFLHRISRILRLNPKCLRVPTAYLARHNFRTMRENPRERNSVVSQERNQPEATPKIDPVSIAQFQRIGYAIYYPQ